MMSAYVVSCPTCGNAVGFNGPGLFGCPHCGQRISATQQPAMAVPLSPARQLAPPLIQPPQISSGATSSVGCSHCRATGLPKSRNLYQLLALFFGTLGIHNFYANRYGHGAAQLGITFWGLAFPPLIAVTIVWSLIDLMLVSIDGQGVPMR